MLIAQAMVLVVREERSAEESSRSESTCEGEIEKWVGGAEATIEGPHQMMKER